MGIGTSLPSAPIIVSRSVYGGYDAILLENTNVNAGVINSTAMKLNAASGGTARIVMQASASNQASSELSFFTGCECGELGDWHEFALGETRSG